MVRSGHRCCGRDIEARRYNYRERILRNITVVKTIPADDILNAVLLALWARRGHRFRAYSRLLATGCNKEFLGSFPFWSLPLPFFFPFCRGKFYISVGFSPGENPRINTGQIIDACWARCLYVKCNLTYFCFIFNIYWKHISSVL